MFCSQIFAHLTKAIRVASLFANYVPISEKNRVFSFDFLFQKFSIKYKMLLNNLTRHFSFWNDTPDENIRIHGHITKGFFELKLKEPLLQLSCEF